MSYLIMLILLYSNHKIHVRLLIDYTCMNTSGGLPLHHNLYEGLVNKDVII